MDGMTASELYGLPAASTEGTSPERRAHHARVAADSGSGGRVRSQRGDPATGRPGGAGGHRLLSKPIRVGYLNGIALVAFACHVRERPACGEPHRVDLPDDLADGPHGAAMTQSPL